MCLYRGISNVIQMIDILDNRTAGGCPKNPTRTMALLRTFNPDINNVMVKQVGTDGEGFPRIVCDDSKKTQNDSVIEYTLCKTIAEGHGLLGVITIEIDKLFVDDNVSSEKGIFCVSSAPIRIIDIVIEPNIYSCCKALRDAVDRNKDINIRIDNPRPLIKRKTVEPCKCKKCEKHCKE